VEGKDDDYDPAPTEIGGNTDNSIDMMDDIYDDETPKKKQKVKVPTREIINASRKEPERPTGRGQSVVNTEVSGDSHIQVDKIKKG
jgi:hypothetical protein